MKHMRKKSEEGLEFSQREEEKKSQTGSDEPRCI